VAGSAEAEVITGRIPHLPEPLSPRTLGLLHLIAADLSDREIARRLGIALSTVKTHVHHLYATLGVHRRTQAIARARSLHLI
jgi:LuxR family maltose regulon positive regulatory protein